MEDIFTPENMAKAKQAKSAEELLALAKESGIELSEETAKMYFDEMNKTGELSDDELDNVSGGCGGSSSPYPPAKFDRDCEKFKCACCGRRKTPGDPEHTCTSGGTPHTQKNHCGICSYVCHDNEGVLRCHVSDYNV